MSEEEKHNHVCKDCGKKFKPLEPWMVDLINDKLYEIQIGRKLGDVFA